MVVLSLGSLKALEEGSTEVLDSTGDSIGEARPKRSELAALITEEDPGGGPITPPTTDPPPTYAWQAGYGGIITTSAGLCVGNTGGEPRTAECSANGAVQTQFFDNTDDDSDQVQVRVDGLCMTRISDDAVAALAACQDGNDDQLWLQTGSGNLASVGSPGQCLDIDGGAVGSPGADVYVWNCHGGGNQAFTFPGAYVPPAQPAVLSVGAADAVLTGAFELDGNGFLYAPNGAPNPAGSATFTFTVADAGQYRMSGSVIAPNGGDDSFFVTTSLSSQRYVWGVTRSTSPTTDFVNDGNGGADVVLDIPAGTTLTVVLDEREDGTRLGSLTLVAV